MKGAGRPTNNFVRLEIIDGTAGEQWGILQKIEPEADYNIVVTPYDATEEYVKEMHKV